jgi:MFS family permease
MRLLFAIPAELDSSDRKLLVLLGAAFFIGQYDMTLLTLALPDVQASFSIAEEDLGKLIAVARLGAIPAILLALVADRIGRRRLLVLTLLGLSCFSLATAFSGSATQFMIFQSSARLFVTLEEILAVIFALEMLPARHRGWGVGFLAAMGGLGSGLASVLYGAVETMPGGWRALYILCGFAILPVAWLRRGLPESAMFAQQADGLQRTFWAPVREIFSEHRKAVWCLALIAASFWFQIGATLNFMSKYLQTTQGYSPGQVSLLFVVAGGVAIFGNIIAGRVSDAVGRRPTLAVGILVNCVALIAFYNSSGMLLPLAWIAALFSFFVVEVIVNIVSGELFPTSCRSTAASMRTIFSVLAGAVGLAVEGSLYTLTGSHSASLSLMALSSLLGLPAVLLWLRETANTRLT